MSYPCLSTKVNTHLLCSIGLSALLYGSEALELSVRNVKGINSVQGSIIKQSMGLTGRSHHTAIHKLSFAPLLGVERKKN